MASLTEVLVLASKADKNAEARLQEYVTTNYPELAKALAVEIAEDGKPLEARQMASLFLKNTLNAKSSATQAGLHERWKQMPEADRTTVKDTLLQAFGSAEPQIPRFAAIAMAEIACVELPYLAWPTFVASMTVADANTPPSVKLASLECLGITCERIEEVQSMLPDVPDLADETVNAMLTAIVQGVQTDDSADDTMRFAALQALHKSLNFVAKNMAVQQERDFIVRTAMCGAVASPSPKVRQLAFRCLDVVAELYYDFLPDYMTTIFELTTNAIQNDPDVDCKMAAIEFWSTVSLTEEAALQDEEAARLAGQALAGPPCKKYVESAMGTLVPLLLETLRQQADDYDEDDFDLPAAGAICLESMSQTTKSAIVPTVIPFVQGHIQSDNWHLRDAAITAFTCILDGPSTATLGPYVQQSIPVLLTAFTDQVETVRDSATHCIATICKLHMGAVVQQQGQQHQVHAIIQSLMTKLTETPRVAGRACAALFNISTSLKTPDAPETNLLSAPMLLLMQALLAAMDRPDAEDKLRVASMSAAAELISASAKDVQSILRDLVPAICERMENALKMQVLSNDDKETREQMLGLLCGLVTALFQRLDKPDLAPAADRIMQTLGQVLQVPNATCHEEAFLSIGAIATSLEDDFAKYLSALMPCLVQGLRNYQSHQLCIVSVGVVVDICSAVGGQIQPYSDQIMGALSDCLKDGSAHRDTKPVVFSCFGDIAMAIGAGFEPYLSVASMLLMQAAQAQLNADDEDLVEFINRLRLSVLEAYTGIIMGLSDGGVLHLLVPNVANIMQFLQYLSTPESYRDDKCLEKAVALIGDIAQQMGTDQSIRMQISQPFVQQIVQDAGQSVDGDTRETANWAHGVVHQVLSV